VDGCTGCEWCIDFCPVDCIDKIDDPFYAGDGTHQVVIVDWDVCTGCTICAKECPWETITMIPGTEVEALLSEDISQEA
jgi:electron transport complex protein RnfB